MRERASLAVAVIVAACGSNVDVSGPGAAGGGAATTTSGTGADSTGSTGSGTAGSGTAGSGTGGSTGSSTTGSTGTAGSGTGGSTGSSGTGGGPPPPTEWCSECAQGASEGPCAGALATCKGDFACNELLGCHTDCEWTAACNAACDGIIPSGVPLLTALLDCVVCVSCPAPCADTSLALYCN